MWDNNTNPLPPAYSQPSFEPVAVAPAPQKSKKPLILIILVAAVVLLLGAGTAVLLLNKPKPVIEETTGDADEVVPIYVTEELVNAFDQVYPASVIVNIQVALNDYFSTFYTEETEFDLESQELNGDDYEWHIKATNGESHVVVVTWRGEDVEIKIDDEFEQKYSNPSYDND